MTPDVRPIPGGSFVMGCDSGRPDEAPSHVVTLPAFEMGRTPVTNREYRAFLDATGGAAPPWWDRAGFDGPHQPVVGVTWMEAAAYAEWLSDQNRACWRLPSEAEWERAARGGLPRGACAWGERVPEGEIPSGALRGPWPAGRGTPNAYGLFDIGTIVHEWCGDWYRADYYEQSPALSPRGPEEGERRVSRGGSWRHHVRWSPPAARSSLPPTYRYADYGFRVLRQR
jgi:formylglycine-generating enzyme required for sulfatase activity